MLWLGIDFETTGLDHEKDRIVEAGAVLWDWETRSPIKIYNTLVKSEVPLSAEAAQVNGLSNEVVNKWGVDEDEALFTIANMGNEADYCVAHNAPFDQGMYDSYWARQGAPIKPERWLDSSVDVPYPANFKQRNLLYVGAMYGFLNPFPHRAVTDVLAMFKVLDQFSPEQIIEYSLAPTVRLRAMVKKPWTDDGESTGWAKSLSYRWEAANKYWFKEVKDFEVEDQIKLAKDKGFAAIQLKGENSEQNN